jgi:SAM-dependent methyltransferase
MDRLRSEQEFHDRQAQLRASTFAQHPDRLHVDDDTYLDHETWIRPAMAALGDVRDLRVLDLGCGHGMASVILSRQGARVTACDLSRGYLGEARQRAFANGISLHLLQADGQRLPFRDCCFDRIWGHAILHHLDLRRAACELYRILRPGGIAVFCEPWGCNPLLNFVRRRCSSGIERHTPHEEPLRLPHLRRLRQVFPIAQVQGFGFFSMLRPILPWRGTVELLDRWDTLLLSRCPAVQRYCRYIMLLMKKID